MQERYETLLNSIRENLMGEDTHIPDSSISNETRSFINRCENHYHLTRQCKEIMYTTVRKNGEEEYLGQSPWTSYTIIFRGKKEQEVVVEKVLEDDFYADLPQDMWKRNQKPQ